MGYSSSASFVNADNAADTGTQTYPVTERVLQDAYTTERKAHLHYNDYCIQAVHDSYPNIAYLFKAFSVSEKIHADNYKRVLSVLGLTPGKPDIKTVVLDTKSNVQTATGNELEKIRYTYPDFLEKLQSEAYEQAIINCMYSWKSHRQHIDSISEIHTYSGFFFSSVVKEIEGRNLDFHVCGICGSTIDEAPQTPCEICNYPLNHYQNIQRPS